MLILTIRTDKPESEVGLFDEQKQLGYLSWQAHRALAETIHTKIQEVLKSHGRTLQDIEGVVCYQGPGSFTGLRIGLSVANSLAYSLEIPIIGIEGENAWLEKGISQIVEGKNMNTVMPEYGSPAHITQAKK